ncbi:unnamed protein product [Schistosoma margrebowiei]|uniref:Egg protein CP391S-like protein n=1 Tax=Schistosoma margrebowiei TaxID=48269 RepID=A0AA85A1G7_9TREM|nr:unnamed protein product [Schistosoma margrebowiei]
MRHNFSSDLSIILCFIAVSLYGFFNCQDICQQPELKDYKKVVFENGSYQYSHHYNYSMRVSLNQPRRVVNGSFNKDSFYQEVKQNFPFKFYDSDVYKFIVFPNGAITMNGKMNLGNFSMFTSNDFHIESEVLEQDKLFAVRWFPKKDNVIGVTGKITGLIHSSGKISIYFEDIPTKINESERQPKLSGLFQCGTTRCAKHNSTGACQNASTSNVTCIWCENANTCIESNDQNTHSLKINDCRNKNMTKSITKENNQDKSIQYLHIVIALVVSFFVVCIGCAIWRWLYKKK